jgi:hypothetical protein
MSNVDMDDSPYKQMLEQAKADYIGLQAKIGECLKEQAQLEKRLVGVRETIVALSKMLGEDFIEEDALGLTDAIRQAFKTYGSSLAPTDVKERLEQSGYDTAKYGNVMASVHSVINRLVSRGEIRSTGTIGGKPAYEWVPVRLSIGQRIAAAAVDPKHVEVLTDAIRKSQAKKK